MKKNLLFLASLATLFACSKDDNSTPDNPLSASGRLHTVVYEDIDDQFSGVRTFSYGANEISISDETKKKNEQTSQRSLQKIILNPQGLAISSEVTSKGVTIELKKATYDASGNITKLVEETFDDTGSKKGVTTSNYTYKEGKISEIEEISQEIENGTATKTYREKTYFKFEGNTRKEYTVGVNSSTGQYPDPDLGTYEQFTYDNNGNLTKEQRFVFGVEKEHTNKEYDTHENPLFFLQTTFDSSIDEIFFKPTGIPTGKNNLKKLTNNDGSSEEFRMEYEKNRPVKYEIYNHKQTLTSKGSITYYP